MDFFVLEGGEREKEKEREKEWVKEEKGARKSFFAHHFPSLPRLCFARFCFQLLVLSSREFDALFEGKQRGGRGAKGSKTGEKGRKEQFLLPGPSFRALFPLALAATVAS